MDHQYIDEYNVAAGYLRRSLSPADRVIFERHLVDCHECTDRLLLAGMFQNRVQTARTAPGGIPLRRRLARVTPLSLALTLGLSAIVLLAVTGLGVSLLTLSALP